MASLEAKNKKLWEDFFKAMLTQQYEAALPIVKKLAVLDPDNPQVRLKTGDVLSRVGDVPGAVGAYHLAAEGLMAAHSEQKALAVYKLILRLSPGDEKARLKKGEIMGEMETGRAPLVRATGRAAEAVSGTTGGEAYLDESAGMPDEGFGYGISIDDLRQEDDEPPAVGFPTAEEPPSEAHPAVEPAMEFGTDSAAAPEIVVPRIFSALSEAERRDLVSMARRRAFANGEEVFREGDPGDSLFVIERGQAIVSTDYKDKTIMFAMLDAGDFFGEMALLTKRPRTATVTAFGDLEVYELTKESVKALVDRQPKVLKDLVNFYYSRVKESREILKGG
jgi:hypothetical protein